MKLDFLPNNVLIAISQSKYNLLCEIRLRKGQFIKVNNGGDYLYLTDKAGKKILCTENDIEETINNVTEFSFYAYNNQIMQGFLSTKHGVRIGVCGEYVLDDKVRTIKNVTSLNIRIPNAVFGCANYIYEKIFNSKVYNTLIVSSPGMGKTTVLKDLIRRIDCEKNLNLMVIDDRGEFVSCKGDNVDLSRFGDKSISFINALRSMAPDIVFMDELSDKNDYEVAKKAINCGIKIVASMHANDENDLIKCDYFDVNTFDRYVFLKSGKEKGVVNKITDNIFNEL